MTRKRAQQTGPSLFDELDEQGATQGGGVFRAPEPQRRGRALRDVAAGELVTTADVGPDYRDGNTIPGETIDRPHRARPPVVAPDEVSAIIARATAEHERLDRAIAAARHRAEHPEETTDHA